MILTISHRTSYRYDAPVPYGLQQMRLTPQSGSSQHVHEWATTVRGGRSEVTYNDQHTNRVELISLDPGSTEVDIVSAGVVETIDRGGIIDQHVGYAPLWLYLRSTELTEARAGIDRLVDSVSPEGRTDDSVGLLHTLAAAIADLITYQTGTTDAATTAEDAIEVGAGVCQDHAHVFISAARNLGFPARYVSGYLMMDDVIEQTASHAWAEAWIDGLGWVGFDVSNGISPDERYVRIAVGVDYSDAAPLAGVRFGDSDEHMQVSVEVQIQQ